MKKSLITKLLIGSILTIGAASVTACNTPNKNNKNSSANDSASEITSTGSETPSTGTDIGSTDTIPNTGSSETPSTGGDIGSSDTTPSSGTDTSSDVPTPECEYTDLSVPGIVYYEDSKLFVISAGGEFIFTGNFEGNILVDAGDDDQVKITLSGFSITSRVDSPIKCLNADELQVSIKKDTVNYVNDLREQMSTEDDSQGKGAIYAACDMKVSGKGTLEVVANYYNGFHTKDDLTIKPEISKGSYLKVKSYNNSLKGNDSVKIESGDIRLISTGGNGIITENTDLSSKGVQRGDINISGGKISIDSAKDAIDAAHDVIVTASETSTPEIDIRTNKYSEYTGDVAGTSTTLFYIRISSQNYSTSYYYGIELKYDDDTTEWIKTKEVSANSRNYKYFVIDRPSNAKSFKVGYFANSVTNMSESNATYITSEFTSINDNYDTIVVNRSNSGLTLGSWTNFASQGGQGGPGGGGPGMSEGNDDKADVSAKGIKADNNITLNGGVYNIKAYDDGIHANRGTAFESGTTGEGNVQILDGVFTIYASDDGIHGDYQVSISGGEIDITNSYEGIEGNIIDISAGYTKVYSTDDGLNASNKAGVTPSINVSGGIVDITVYGQDVDGIDSNGNFLQTGGLIVTKGGNSNMSTGLDVDGTCKINAGTLIAFGKTEKTPTLGSGVSSFQVSGSYSAGTHTISFTDGTSLTVSTKYSYSTVYVYSSQYSNITVK